MTTGPLHGPGVPVGHRMRVADDQRDALAARTLELPTAEDTHEFGRRLGAVLHAGDLVVLGGPLGAGKTALVQGIGAGMGVQGRIASPTFVIARVHPAGQPHGATLVHVDAYRLGLLGEVDDLDLDVDLADAVVVVEWGAGLVEQLSDAYLHITLARAADSEVRTARIEPYGGDWAERVVRLLPAS
jgi:tRNA threonylcarbamoyladenosine biosynthesis protein TsaE